MPSATYSSFLSKALRPVSPEPGESGYFAAPDQNLDPRLFDGDHIKPPVRQWILNTLYGFWGPRYHGAHSWSTVWIAGSGISYQWSAGRGNGDLDVLIGIDFPRFFQANQKFLGLSENDVADIVNQEFHAELWPTTATQQINGGTFEVTFYVNPGSTDIRDIHPYAAYDLTHDSWTVRPPSGKDFEHPQEYYDAADRERWEVNTLVDQYNRIATGLSSLQTGSPRWMDALHQADLVAAQAQSMFDQIHLGRRNAFGPNGSGYGDYYNFRWQYHKQHGTVQALRAVGRNHEEARSEYAQAVYGQPIDAADVALRRAALWNRGGNGR